jgi:serine protease Do
MYIQTTRFALPSWLALVLFCLALTAGNSFAKSETEGDTAILDRYSKAFVNVVKKTKPAVVHIKVEKSSKPGAYGDQSAEEMFNHPFFEQFFGPQFRQQQPRQQEFRQRGQGSGFIISEKGHILTNNHVVEDADVVKVVLSDNREFVAKIVGTDPQSDVALLKIDDPANLPVLALGDSNALEVGEWVIAIGNPFGLSQTVTVGVVSATGRSSVGINEYENFIQTDAAINPGNSGGPLLNGRGEVVGINTALFSRTGGYMGIGFAIPINMAKSIENQLQASGKVVRGWLGVVIQNVDKNLAESFGLKKAEGILVSEVQKDSPASGAGLQRDDIILRLNDSALSDVSDLRNRVALLPPGSKAALDIIRDGREKKIQVTIGEQPSGFSSATSSATKVEKEKETLDKYGLTLQPLTQELAERFNFKDASGLIISGVQPGSPASLSGLKPGYLVEEINKVKVKNLSDLKTSLSESSKSGKLLLRVRFGDYSTYVVLTTK